MDVIFESKGSFEDTERWLRRMSSGDIMTSLDYYGQKGVSALRQATPVDTGETAASWTYEVKRRLGTYEIIWSNTNVKDKTNIAIILQYGHGTGTGGYVHGYDYINPTLRPIFDEISDKIWKEVKRRG